MRSVFVSIEGFNLKQGYIIKELSIIHTDNTFQHYHFKVPDTLIPTAAEMKTINYTEIKLNEFSLKDECYLPNDVHLLILNNFKNFRIYVAGELTKLFLSNIITEADIIDICSIFDFQYPKVLDNPQCFVVHKPRYCSLAKARHIKAVFENKVL